VVADADGGEHRRAPALHEILGDRGQHAFVEQVRGDGPAQHQAAGRGRLVVGVPQGELAEPPGGLVGHPPVAQRAGDQGEDRVGDVGGERQVVVVGDLEHGLAHRGQQQQQQPAGLRRSRAQPLE